MKGEEKLALLVEIQKIDSKILRLKEEKGDLPKEIMDLESIKLSLQIEQEKLEKEIEKQKRIITENENIKIVQTRVKESREELLRKGQFRSEKDFKAAEAEVELATLDIQTAEKKIMKAKKKIRELEEKVNKLSEKRDRIIQEMEDKRALLKEIENRTAQLEQELRKEREKLISKLDEKLRNTYEKILRKSEGIAVVTLDRDACGGCFILLPPQVLYEIRLKNKIIFCETCGRIVVDPSFFGNETYWQEREATATKKKKRKSISKK